MSIFQIPELASLICHFSDSKSCARMTSVCRATFRAAVPIVWHTVDGADKLLSLIPDTVHRYDTYGGKRLVSIEIPFFAGTTRYEIYAPSVRRLDVYGKSQHFFQVIGWHTLMTQGRHRIPPPKLKCLCIQTLDSGKAEEQLFWISVFASSSTREIKILPGSRNPSRPPWVSHMTCAVLLQTILSRCPEIESLGIYPSMTASSDRPGDKGNCYLFLINDGPYELFISRFQNLVELDTTTSMYYGDCLTLLGQLPHLESLSIYRCVEELEEPFTGLEDDAFPALKKLSIHHTDYRDIEVILMTPNLTRRLTTLSIYGALGEIETTFAEGEDAGSWIATHFLSHLKNATHLENLTISFDAYGVCDESLVLEGFALVVAQLSAFPLKRLALHSVIIPLNDVLGPGFSLPLWSRLTHLQLPSLEATDQVLIRLATMPQLQYLFVKLRISDTCAQPPVPDNSKSPLRTLEGGVGSTINANLDNFDQHVRFLSSLWPNLEDIVWPESAADVQTMYIGFLNKHLKSRSRRLLGGT